MAATRAPVVDDQKRLDQFERFNGGKPQALRALNLLENMNGRNLVHRDATESEQRRAYLAGKLPGIILTT